MLSYGHAAEISLNPESEKGEGRPTLSIRRSAERVYSLGNCGGWI
jgi:hypothetical protein